MVSYTNFKLVIKRTDDNAAGTELTDFVSFRFTEEKNRVGQLKLTALKLSSAQKTALGEPDSKIGSYLIIQDRANSNAEIDRFRIRNTSVQEYTEFYDITAMQLAVDFYDAEIKDRKEYPTGSFTTPITVINDLIGTRFKARISNSLRNRPSPAFRVEPGPMIQVLSSYANALGADWYVDYDSVNFKARFNLVHADDQNSTTTLALYASDGATVDASVDRFISRKSNATSGKNYKPVLKNDVFQVRRLEDDEKVYNDVQAFGVVAGFNSPRCRIYDSTGKLGNLSAALTTDPPVTTSDISFTLNSVTTAFTTTSSNFDSLGYPVVVLGNEAMKLVSVGSLSSGSQTLTVRRFGLPNTQTSGETAIPQVLTDLGYQPSNLSFAGTGSYKHSIGVVCYQLFDSTATGGEDTPETGTSIFKYKRRQATFNQPNIIDQDTIDQITRQAFYTYRNPKTRIEIFLTDQLVSAFPGDRIDLLASDGVTSDSGGVGYIVEKAEYSGDENGVYYVLNEYRLYFYDNTADLQKDTDQSFSYGQGSNSIVTNDIYDNIKCHTTQGSRIPLVLRPFIPQEVKAINAMLLTFDLQLARSSSGAAGGAGTSTLQADGTINTTTLSTNTVISNSTSFPLKSWTDVAAYSGTSAFTLPSDIRLYDEIMFKILVTRSFTTTTGSVLLKLEAQGINGSGSANTIVFPETVAIAAAQSSITTSGGGTANDRSYALSNINNRGIVTWSYAQSGKVLIGDSDDNTNNNFALSPGSTFKLLLYTDGGGSERAYDFTVKVYGITHAHSHTIPSHRILYDGTDAVNSGTQHQHPADITFGSSTTSKLDLLINNTDRYGINTNGTLTTAGAGSSWTTASSTLTQPIDILPVVLKAYANNIRNKFLNIKIEGIQTSGNVARLEANLITEIFLGTSSKVQQRTLS